MISLLFCLLLAKTPADTFVMANVSEPETLDPHRLTTHNDAFLAMQIFEGVLGRSSDYGTLKPAIAESWKVSKDGRTYTFMIRKGLRWSNGDPLTVEHIRSSWLRAMRPDIGNSFLNWYTDNIEGALDYVKSFAEVKDSTTEGTQGPASNDKKGASAEAKVGIRIKNAQTIEIKLKAASTHFIEYLANPPFFVIHPSMLDTSDVWQQPEKFVVNGPYVLRSWAINKDTRYEKNKFHWQAASVKIPKFIATVVTEETTVYNLYKSGAIDWTNDNTISTGLIASLRSQPDFYLSPSFATYMFLFNVTKKPFDDKRVRRALALAIHRAEITDKILRGGQVPTQRLVLSGIKGYRPTIIPPWPYDRQLEEARRLLAEAGYPEGKGFPRVTLKYNTTEAHAKIAQAIQQMWKKNLGITSVQLENKEWNVFMKEQSLKQFEISRQTWIGDIADPVSMLELFLGAGSSNYTGWSHPRYDKILTDASQIRDQKKRYQQLAKAEELILGEYPFIPIYHPVWFGLVSSSIKGFEPNPFGFVQLKYLEKR